ncbi:MAG: aldo/keto reductase, partial [Chloroflexota bacterium]
MIDDPRYSPLGFGGTTFGAAQWGGQAGADLLAAMAAALEGGITHFDTASGYGAGDSERMIGQFLAADPSRRERIFLASKANIGEITAQAMLAEIDGSRARLQTDLIDLYYIHWPRTGKDLRPLMDGLQTARVQGKIRFVGVSNFSVAQMEQIAQAGRIDAHQMDYSLLWRFNERDLIPYCRTHSIDVVSYASLAHGILAGKFGRDLHFEHGDQRNNILLFRNDVWAE